MKSLQINQLSKRYGQNKYILSGLTHTFKEGTATALMGANGAGKTTFLRLVSTAAFPTSGEVTYDGINIHQEVHKYLQHVGIVSDAGDLPQFLTARELVEGVMRSRKTWSESGEEAMAELFKKVELDERRNSLIGTYSSGMLQKTMIAAAFAGNPKILLLDEPFRALDESAVVSVMQMLAEFKRSGGIILISSHQKATLEVLCDEFIEFPYLK
jgi:ABC-type multidrug transport system ATPase subunit